MEKGVHNKGQTGGKGRCIYGAELGCQTNTRSTFSWRQETEENGREGSLLHSLSKLQAESNTVPCIQEKKR